MLWISACGFRGNHLIRRNMSPPRFPRPAQVTGQDACPWKFPVAVLSCCTGLDLYTHQPCDAVVEAWNPHPVKISPYRRWVDHPLFREPSNHAPSRRDPARRVDLGAYRARPTAQRACNHPPQGPGGRIPLAPSPRRAGFGFAFTLPMNNRAARRTTPPAWIGSALRHVTSGNARPGHRRGSACH